MTFVHSVSGLAGAAVLKGDERKSVTVNPVEYPWIGEWEHIEGRDVNFGNFGKVLGKSIVR